VTEPPNTSWSDERIDQIIGNLLRTGVILATVVVTAGGILYLFRHGTELPEYRKFQAAEPALSTASGIIHLVLHNRSRGVIQIGILLLIATPVARVAFSAVAFALQRDWTYVTVTLLVLAVLLFSLFVT
jgi:uncharacterized membrane protein